MIRRPAVERRGAWIPWLFVGLFGIVVVVNGIMIWLAIGTFPGLVTDRPYDRGLAYNRNLEAAAAQDALGWQARLAARLEGPTTAVFELELHDRDDRPVDGAEVRAEVRRPVGTGLDFDVVLKPIRPGVYRAAAALPQPGAWDVHLVVERGQALFVVDERFVLR